MRCVVVLTLALAATGVSAQKSAARFEVASVKPSNPDSDRGPFNSGYLQILPEGGVRTSYKELLGVIALGYGLDELYADLKLDAGTHRKFLSAHFDIEARGGSGPLAEKLKTLLVERFGLVVHWETRQGPIWEATLKEPGKLGRWLKPSTVRCRRRDPRTDVPAGCAARPQEYRYGLPVSWGSGPMEDLLRQAQTGGMPVVDRTGLQGNYAWEVAFVSGRDAPTDAPRLLDAFEDQLGIKLVKATGPREMLVIDDVHEPTPN